MAFFTGYCGNARRPFALLSRSSGYFTGIELWQADMIGGTPEEVDVSSEPEQ